MRGEVASRNVWYHRSKFRPRSRRREVKVPSIAQLPNFEFALQKLQDYEHQVAPTNTPSLITRLLLQEASLR